MKDHNQFPVSIEMLVTFCTRLWWRRIWKP